MYRELIDSLIKNNEWAHLNPAATEKDIEKAEVFIGYSFPDELKALYLETNGDNYFLLSLEQMIENVKLNREYFPDCFETFEEYLARVDRFIYFAINGCGDYYCYKASSDATPSPIYLWEHELFEAHRVADDLQDVIIKYYSSEI